MKIFVREKLINDSLSGSIDFFIERLEEAIKKTGAPRDKVIINLDYDEDSVDCFLTLEFEREETEQEKAARIKRAFAAEYAEREQYRRLKEKFGDK